MLSLFRRFAASPFGIGLFGIITLAFVVTLYNGRASLGGLLQSGSSDTLATVGDSSIDAAEVKKRAANELEGERQRTPTIDMKGFVAEGGIDQTVDFSTTASALEQFARAQGMVASRKAVDGEIASNPAFAGPTGGFDQARFRALLAERSFLEADVRGDIGRDIVTKSMIIPVAGVARVPAALVEPYSALLIEARKGQIVFAPSALFAPHTAPSEAEIGAYYRGNIARYTVPERRTVRYTAFDKAHFAGKVAATDTEIAQAYTTAAAQYAAKERRAFTQIIVPQQDQANAVAAKVKGGLSMNEAARSVQREAIPVAATDEAGLAKVTSPDVARAAFAAARGDVAAVTHSPFGYHVVRVDQVTRTAAVPLAAVRSKLASAIEEQKQQRALADFVAQIDGAITSKATIDEVAGKFGLTLLTTPSVTREGTIVGGPATALPPEAAATLKDAFQAEPGDPATVLKSGTSGTFVLWKLDRKIPAAPVPLAQAHDAVARDVQLFKGAKGAKIAANSIAAALNAGAPLAQAMTKSPVALPAPQAAGGRRSDLAQAPPQARAPLSLMFSIAEHHARVLEVPGGNGWMIVYLDTIVHADPHAVPGLIAAIQQKLSGVFGSEYSEQFETAVRKQVGVTKNPAAIAALKRDLVGGGR